MEDIHEDIKEENVVRDSIQMPKVETLDNKADGSCEESEIDGLLKWAKELPDDIALQSS
jgi:hypothetical protein